MVRTEERKRVKSLKGETVLVETSPSRSEGVYQASPLQKPIHYRTLVIGDKSTIDRGDGDSVDQSHVLPAPDNQTSENN